MLVFEVDGPRIVPATGSEPRKDRFEADIHAVLTDHLSKVIGNRVFTVARRGPEYPELPYLIMLDTAGQIRVVDVVYELDDQSFMRSMCHGERVLAWPWGELEAHYPAGASRFESDWAAFRQLTSPVLRGSMPRLLIICAQASVAAHDVSRLLARQDSGVRVFKAGELKDTPKRTITLEQLETLPRPHRPTDPMALTDVTEIHLEGWTISEPGFPGPLPPMPPTPHTPVDGPVRPPAGRPSLADDAEAFLASYGTPRPGPDPVDLAGGPGPRAEGPADGVPGPAQNRGPSPVRRRSGRVAPAQPPAPPPSDRATAEARTAPTPSSVASPPDMTTTPSRSRRMDRFGDVPPAPAPSPSTPTGRTPLSSASTPYPSGLLGPPDTAQGPGPNLPPRGPALPADPSQAMTFPVDPAQRSALPVDPPQAMTFPVDPAQGSALPVDPPQAMTFPVDPTQGVALPVDPSRGAAGPDPFGSPTGPQREVPAGGFPWMQAPAPVGPPSDAVGSVPTPVMGGGPVPGPPALDVRTPPPVVGSPLADLARGRGGEVLLVWERRRRGVRYEARLTADGAIVLPDGRRFTDPSQAAQAAAEYPADGWHAWRLGVQGPTLAEALSGQAG